MENFGGSGVSGVTAVMKKRRTATSRRPRPETQLESRGTSPLSSTPSLTNTEKLSPDDNGGSDNTFRRKEYYLNSPPPRTLCVNIAPSKKIRTDDKISGVLDGYYGVGSSRIGHGSDLKRCIEGVLAPAKLTSVNKVKERVVVQLTSSESDGNVRKNGDGYDIHNLEGVAKIKAENKLRKVKLKVGGVTHMLHTKSDLDTGGGGPFSTNPPLSSAHRVKFIAQDYSDGHSPPESGNGFQGDAWNNFGDLGFSCGAKEDSKRVSTATSLSGKLTDKFQGMPSSEPTRKSKRVPKKRVFDHGEEDDYIHHLGKSNKVPADHAGEFEENDEDGAKKLKPSKLSKNKNTPHELEEDYVMSRSSKENRKRSRPGKESEDMDYIEEEEPASIEVPNVKRKKQKASADSPADVRIEPLTTRQRALQLGKGGNGESSIEFPNGLPPAPSRKTKEKLSEVEIQARKAEAAQRRRMQVEKQARETQASAIRKILGHDSDKKKEEKKQKELEEKEKAAKSKTLGPSTIRWVIGPNGTLVTFAEDVGLPSILSSKPHSYPPPREKCAGPSCTNPYKYRDSKSKLPLCSLECYRAVQGSTRPLTLC